MAVKRELTSEDALAIIHRQRQVNREAAKRFRKAKIKAGYYYMQYWVPEEAKDDAKAALEKVVAKAEAAREAAASTRKRAKS